MELWLIITLVAAFLQNARSLLQKRLTGRLSVNGASYVRFLYALPFAWMWGVWLWGGSPSGLNTTFWVYCGLGAIAQILATSALLAAFTDGNFAVGTAFSKTEAAQAALFGVIILSEGVSLWVILGIMVSLVGVVLLSGSNAPRNFRWQQLLKPSPAVWFGLAAGAGFAISAVGFRGASLSLDGGDYLQRAGLTLMVSVTIQTLTMGTYLILREPGELQRTLKHWRVAVWIGAIGALASAGWFTAMTLKNAAMVRAVGQIELLFTIITSVWLLGERLKTREVAGICLVVLGILLLLR